MTSVDNSKAGGLYYMNAALDERVEREARHYISEGQIERKDGQVFFEGDRLLSRFEPIFHRLLDEEEANERWEKGMEKI